MKSFHRLFLFFFFQKKKQQPIQDLFNEILSRVQSIEQMNDVAVKFIEETKVILSFHIFISYILKHKICAQ